MTFVTLIDPLDVSRAEGDGTFLSLEKKRIVAFLH